MAVHRKTPCSAKHRIERKIKKQIRQNTYRWYARANQEKESTQKQCSFFSERKTGVIDKITSNN